MNQYINKLIAGNDLSAKEVSTLFHQFLDFNIEQQAAIVSLLAAKKESLEELSAAKDFMLQHATPIICEYDVVDIVGTGGDNIGTFNISTAASIVIASCGAYVAKHGGRSASGKTGSADVIETLGIKPGNSKEEIINSLTKNHYGYIWAPLFNPLLKNYSLLRKNLGFPTIFNILGPLINPIYPKRQVIGVYRQDLVDKLTTILSNSGSKHFVIINSLDGLDEISISAPTFITEFSEGIIKKYKISPPDFGISIAPVSEIIGGDAKQNNKIIYDIFAKKISGPKLEVVVLNAAAGLLVSGLAKNFKDGVDMARQAISSGKTIALLNQLKST